MGPGQSFVVPLTFVGISISALLQRLKLCCLPSDLPLFCCRSYSSTSIEEAMKRGEDPPTPPPRPQKTHSRASSLDLNKVFQPSVPGEVPLCTPVFPFPVEVTGCMSATEAFVSPQNEQIWPFPVPGRSSSYYGILGRERSSRQIDIPCVWSLAHTRMDQELWNSVPRGLKYFNPRQPTECMAGVLFSVSW